MANPAMSTRPRTSKYGRTPPNKQGGVGRPKQQRAVQTVKSGITKMECRNMQSKVTCSYHDISLLCRQQRESHLLNS